MMAPVGEDWFWLAMGAISFANVLAEFWRRKTAGGVLLDLGVVPGRAFSLVGGVIIVIACLARMLFSRGRIWFEMFAFLGWGCSIITDATRRFQIREAGIFGRSRRLIRWRQIAGYEISPIGSLSLKLQGRSWKFYCDVPAALRPEVEKLLSVKCPDAASALVGLKQGGTVQ